MPHPPIEDLLENVDSRFTLVTLVTRRAHQLNNKAPRLLDNPHSTKPVSIALEEIYAKKIKPKRPKEKSGG